VRTDPIPDGIWTVEKFGEKEGGLNFGETLTIQSYRHPDKIAVEDDSKRISYRELNDRVNRLVHGFTELGLKKGDIICHLQGNTVEHFELLFAVAKAGMVRMPLNPRGEKSESIKLVNTFEPQAFLYEQEFSGVVREISPYIKCPRFIFVGKTPPFGSIAYDALAVQDPNPEPDIEVEEGDPFLIQSTSGTTGFPKAALISQGGLIRRAIIRAMDLNNHSRGVYLGVTALANTASLFYACSQLYLGGTVILRNRFDPAKTAETIREKQVTHLSMVPVMWEKILRLPGLKAYDFRSLEIAVSYGAPLHQSTKEKFIQDLSPNLFETFGITETGPISNLHPRDQLRKRNCVGQPTMHTQIRIVDENGRELPPKREGEIVVRTPYLFMGYFRNPEATAEVLRDGWFYTGDIGRLDEEHYLYILGRKKDMIISGGYNIYAEEIEGILASHPKIHESAVIGVPDEEWGESVKALVVLKAGLDANQEEIIEFCKARLADYKKPRTVEFVPTLPRSGPGKIAKNALREKYWAGLERKVN
jgi:acyl-CoA synthetase (AMP-forming)/AMP-acid ligase II